MIDIQAALNRKYSNLERQTNIDQQKADQDFALGQRRLDLSHGQLTLGQDELGLKKQLAVPEIEAAGLRNSFLKQATPLLTRSFSTSPKAAQTVQTASPLSLSSNQWNTIVDGDSILDKGKSFSDWLYSKRGTTFVKDKTGKGSPKKDTVPAVLAEGEAVLNAGAAEILGRDAIEALNQEGQKRLGLSGAAHMVDGELHAVQGFVDLPGMEGRFIDGAAADAWKKKWFSDVAKVPPKTAPSAFTEKEILQNMLRRPSIESLVDTAAPAAKKMNLASQAGQWVGAQGGFGGAAKTLGKKALGGAARVAIPALATVDAMGDGFEYVPNEGEHPLSSTAKHTALKVGDIATRGLDFLSTDPVNFISGKEVIKPFNTAYKENFINAGIAKQRPVATEPAAGHSAANTNRAGPRPEDIQFEKDKAAIQAMDDRMSRDVPQLNDEAFIRMGLSPGDRVAATAYNVGEYNGGGLRRMNTGVPGQEIYRKGNSYYGVGAAPSEAPEQGLKRGLMMAALGGSKEAGMLLGSMENSESAAADRENRLEVARIAAGSKKGDELSLNDRIKLGETLRGEGYALTSLQEVEQRKKDLLASVQEKMKSVTDPNEREKLANYYESERSKLDKVTGTIDTENLSAVKNIGLKEDKVTRAVKGGLLGAAPGVALTAASFIPQLRWLRPAGLALTGLSGAAGAGYGAHTGSMDFNEMSSLESLNPSNPQVKVRDGVLYGENGEVLPLDLLPPSLRRLYLK